MPEDIQLQFGMASLCTFDIPVIITGPSPLTVNTVSKTDAACSGNTNGEIIVNASGGVAPFSYSINGGTAQNSGTFSNLGAGIYTVSVSDANSCTSAASFTISEPAVISISAVKTDAECPDEPSGSITLTIEGGIVPYNVIWSDGVTTQDRQNITDGTYSAVVTDKNGCAGSQSVVVGVIGSERCLIIPDIITPNNDGYNDTWKIKNIDLFPNAEVSVFNRWGKQVFNSRNIAGNPWDGTYNGKSSSD